MARRSRLSGHDAEIEKIARDAEQEGKAKTTIAEILGQRKGPCTLPVSWLGPSSKKQFNVRRGGTVTIGSVIGHYPGTSRAQTIGRTGKVKKMGASSIIVELDGPCVGQSDCQHQVTSIIVPCSTSASKSASLDGRKKKRR